MELERRESDVGKREKGKLPWGDPDQPGAFFTFTGIDFIWVK
jgi:hypothetical protein